MTDDTDETEGNGSQLAHLNISCLLNNRIELAVKIIF